MSSSRSEKPARWRQEWAIASRPIGRAPKGVGRECFLRKFYRRVSQAAITQQADRAELTAMGMRMRSDRFASSAKGTRPGGSSTASPSQGPARALAQTDPAKSRPQLRLWGGGQLGYTTRAMEGGSERVVGDDRREIVAGLCGWRSGGWNQEDQEPTLVGESNNSCRRHHNTFVCPELIAPLPKLFSPRMKMPYFFGKIAALRLHHVSYRSKDVCSASPVPGSRARATGFRTPLCGPAKPDRHSFASPFVAPFVTFVPCR
jgi:hypothetical protein